MTIKQIPIEERNSLCFDCEYCRQTIKGKECCIGSEHIFRDEKTGMLICENRDENED